MKLHREILFGIGDRRAQRLDRRGDLLQLRAIAEHRHSALGEVGHWKAGGERKHYLALEFQLCEQ